MKFLICFAVLVSSSFALAEGTPPINFHKVTNQLFRGGKLTEANVVWLREHKVKTIIKLDDENFDELKWGTNVSYFHINKLGINLSFKLVSRVLQAIEEGKRRGAVYVHCEKGADRTGLIIALYRVKHGWSVDQAREEMNAPEFGHSSLQVWMDHKFEIYAPLLQTPTN